jgi:two-component system cell cycle sensor histidine kinase/response regulator CckA
MVKGRTVKEDPIRVLLIDDNRGDYLLMDDHLSRAEGSVFDLEWAETYDKGLAAIQGRVHHIYLVDYHLGIHDGLALMKEAVRMGCEVPFIMLTELGDREIDMAAMEAGAYDYLVKSNLTPELLERAIRYALRSYGTERALKQSEKRFRTLIEEHVDAMLLIDQEEKVLYVNKAAETLFNVRPDQLLGTSFGVPVIDKKSAEINIIGREGKPLTLEMRSVKTQWQGKDVYLASLRDVTKRRMAEIERQEMQEQLRHSQKMEAIGTLSGGIAHDFNNILSAIIGYSELSLSEVDHESLVAGSIREILKAGRRGLGACKADSSVQPPK